MCVCVQLPRADRVLRFSIKQLDYPAVVYRGAVLAICRCCHLTERWPAALLAEKYGLIEEPLRGAVFEFAARRTAPLATDEGLEGSCS